MTGIEALALNRIISAGLPEGVPQHRFHPTRRWRFDRAWPERMVALELEGGIYRHGWHQSIGGYQKDLDKYNAAAIIGWKVIRCSREDVRDGTMVRLLSAVLTPERALETVARRFVDACGIHWDGVSPVLELEVEAAEWCALREAVK